MRTLGDRLPAVRRGAFPHGTQTVTVDGADHRRAALNWPAVGLSCAGRDAHGMPVGVQVVGRPFGESTVLAVARAVEQRLGGPPPLDCLTERAA